MKEKIYGYFKFGYPLFLLLMSMIATFLDNWIKAVLFIVLYAICIIDDRLTDIHMSIRTLWYRIYLRNKKDGIE
ncbi:hypothetical protein [Enterococcus alishanensis]